MYLNYSCMPISFNNPIKASFSNKKYPDTIQTRTSQIVNSIFRLKTGFDSVVYCCTKT